MHRELNLPNPLENKFNLERCRRVKGNSVNRKFAVTPPMLAQFFEVMDF